MIALTNFKIFDGETAELGAGTVVIDGDRIVSVSPAPPPPGADVVEGGGRTLMPGLIDAHIHAYAIDVNTQRIIESPPSLLALWGGWVLRRSHRRLQCPATTIITRAPPSMRNCSKRTLPLG